MKRLMALMALTILTACDKAPERSDARAEREDRLYQTAMNDYRAGRLDAAVKGFEKAIRKDPSNSSARFQLACLLQDSKHDFLGAVCCYHEFILQEPSGDKAKLAKDRLALCESELAKALAEKHGLLRGERLVKDLETAGKKLKAMEKRAFAAEQELETVRARVTALATERERLLAIVKDAAGGDDRDTVATGKPSVREAKDLLDEDDEADARAKVADEAAALLKEDESAGVVDRIRLSEDVASLRSDEMAERESGSSLLPTQKPNDKAKRDAVAEAEKAKQRKDFGPLHPDTYVVQEGDTLYRVAKRFYGRASAWKIIRDANKDKISMDNRLHVGDTIRLPQK